MKTLNIREEKDFDKFYETTCIEIGQGFKPFSITIGKLKEPHTLEQLNLYWHVITQIKNALNEFGNTLSKEETSDMMKVRFHYKEVHLPNGKIEKTLKSIAFNSETEKLEMSDFINNMMAWAGNEGIHIDLLYTGEIE